MAPSASMLFLSYHQLHSRPTTTEVAVGVLPRREEEAAAPGGAFRMSVRSVLSLALFQRRPETVPSAEGKTTTLHVRDVGEEVKAAAVAAADANKELERKFEEAVRLSCWSS